MDPGEEPSARKRYWHMFPKIWIQPQLVFSCDITGYCGRLHLLTEDQLTDPSLKSIFTKTTTFCETMKRMPTKFIMIYVYNLDCQVHVDHENFQSFRLSSYLL